MRIRDGKNLSRRCAPFLIIAIVLFIFIHPIFHGKSLTNWDDRFVLPPWSLQPPAGWFHSNGIDGAPIYLLNPSDLLNRELIKKFIPLAWNPYNGFGTPLLGTMQPSPYYPPKLISYFAPDYWRGQDAMLVGLLLIAGIGNYLLLRLIGAGDLGAIFAAIAYMLSQRLLMIINMASFQVEALLPIMLFAILLMCRRRTMRHAAFVGALGGIQFLGGFPESSFTLCVIGGLFFLWFFVFQAKGDERGRLLILGVSAALLTLAVSAFQLGEFVRLLPRAWTSHTTSYGAAVKTPFWLMPLMVPNFFGVPFTAKLWINGVSPHDHMIVSLFCGISTVIFAAVSIFGPSRKYRAYCYFFFGILILYLGYDFGFPVLRDIGYLPLFDRMSIAWNAFAIPFALSVLAGLGLDALCRERGFAKTVVAICIYLAIAVALSWSLYFEYPKPVVHAFRPLLFIVPLIALAVGIMRVRGLRLIGGSALIVLLSAELYHADRPLNYMHSYGAAPRDPPSLDWLRDNVGHERILGLGGFFPSNTLMPYRIRDIRLSEALFPKAYVDYVDSVWGTDPTYVSDLNHADWRKYEDPLLDIAAIKFLVAPSGMKAASADLEEVYRDQSTAIYRNRRALPRSRFVAYAEAAPDGLTPAQLKERSSELSTRVYLADYRPTPRPEHCGKESGGPEIAYLRDEPDRVDVTMTAPCAGFMVLADLYYPGWTATVDGVKAHIYQADLVFRGVAVGPGPHEIVFDYNPWTIRYGVPLAVMGWLAIFAFMAHGSFAAVRRRNRRPPSV